MGHSGNPVHGSCAHGRPAMWIGTTIGEIVRLGAAAAQLGLAVARHTMRRDWWRNEGHGGQGRTGCGGCVCCSVRGHDCVECRPRVYPRGCCQ